jgi:hypothetical protein
MLVKSVIKATKGVGTNFQADSNRSRLTSWPTGLPDPWLPGSRPRHFENHNALAIHRT